MKSTILIKQIENYLYITTSNEYNKKEFISYIKTIKDECEKERIYNVLWNLLDMNGNIPQDIDRFYIGEAAAKVFEQKIKLAIVWHKQLINKFCENVAVNRGARLKVFDDVDAAKNWLNITSS